MHERMTVGELKERLRGIDDDWEITFGDVLTFYRLKVRGEKLMDLEFNEVFTVHSEEVRGNIRELK